MTVGQQKKLETILGKLEALQSEVGRGNAYERLQVAKAALIRALHAKQ